MKNQFSQEQINDTAVSLGIPTIPFFQRRIARAYDLVETNKVTFVTDDISRVRSQYDPKAIYTVEVNHGNPHCTCPDNERTIFCKHSIASMMLAKAQEQKASKLTIYDESKGSRYGRWQIMDYGKKKGYIVDRDSEGTLSCPCCSRSTQCRHKKAVRTYIGGNAKITSECGTETAKALQDKLNGSNGTGDNQTPVHHQLDTSNPFQECEQLDIDQIEGRSWRVRRDDNPSRHALGDLVHVLSNGEYVISYRGIMALAEQHGVTFEASRHDETRTVIAYGHRGGNSRASGKPINGSEMTAVELAKRNAARQLLSLVDIKALEKKAQLEAEFDWEVAQRKCLEIVPDFKLDILIHDLVQADTLRQAHPSDYNRKEWLMIFDAVKKDAETNGIDDDDGGDDPPSSDDEQPIAVCCICGRTLTNKLSISRCVGPECYKKVGAQGAQFLRDDEVSEELIKASQLYRDEALQKRILRACLTLDAPPPVKALNWLGNEYFGYKNRPILYYVCADGQLSRLDTHRRKLRHRIITSETAETELDAHALAQMATDVAEEDALYSATREEPLGTMDEFVERCKEMESEVDDPAPMVDLAPANCDGKRKLQIDRKRNIVLIESDGIQKPMTFIEVSRTFGGDVIMRLTQGIQLCGADISTVELDN